MNRLLGESLDIDDGLLAHGLEHNDTHSALTVARSDRG